MTAVEWLIQEHFGGIENCTPHFRNKIEQAKEMEKQEKIALLKSLVYSVCIGDDVEDVEEWLKEHELNNL